MRSEEESIPILYTQNLLSVISCQLSEVWSRIYPNTQYSKSVICCL